MVVRLVVTLLSIPERHVSSCASPRAVPQCSSYTQGFYVGYESQLQLRLTTAGRYCQLRKLKMVCTHLGLLWASRRDISRTPPGLYIS